jgi:hypothetical protein
MAFTGFGDLPANLDWSGSMLDQDLSAGGIAHATFLPGGTLRITGQIRNEFTVPIFNGLLLEATVQAFELNEDNNTDVLTISPGAIVTPTGGYLVTNGDMVMNGDYYLNGKVSAAKAAGGSISSFGEDIVTVAGVQWNLVQVPEPATVALLGLSSLLVLRRRR